MRDLNDVRTSSSSRGCQLADPNCEASAAHDELKPRDQMSNAVCAEDAKRFILKFLSTASSGQLALASMGLIVMTYALLGRLGLLLIGLVLGIVLHTSWEDIKGDSTPEVAASRGGGRRGELTLELVGRLLDLPKHESAERGNGARAILKGVSDGSVARDLDYSVFGPKTSAALRSLTDAVIRDYVIYWYGPILPSESTFPLSCRAMLADFISSVASHLLNKRTAEIFLQFLMNASSIIIVFLSELSAAFQAAGDSVPPEEAVSRYLKQYPESSLSNVLASDQQRKKLNMVAGDVLSAFLDENAHGCALVRNFLREVLAGVVLESATSNLSRPDFINSWIIYLFSEGEPELMSAIDAGVEGARNQGITASKTPWTKRNPEANAVDKFRPGQWDSSIRIGHPEYSDKVATDTTLEASCLADMITSQNIHGRDPQQEGPSCSADDTELGEIAPISSSADNTSKSFAYKQVGISDAGGTGQSTHPKVALLPPMPGKSSSDPEPYAEELNRLPHMLYGAYVSVDDVSTPNETGTLKSKPTSEYLLQIEPFAAQSTGWMAFRTYTDFESLHETLSTISRINRIHAFIDQHPRLPTWKGETRQTLAMKLERYMKEALRHESLAESGKMKKFLEKGTRPGHSPSAASPRLLSSSHASLESVGKAVLGAFSNSPKGITGNSRAVFGGATGALGSVTPPKKQRPTATTENEQDIRGFSTRSLPHSSPSEHVREGTSSSGSKDQSLMKDKDAEGHFSSSSVVESHNIPRSVAQSLVAADSPKIISSSALVAGSELEIQDISQSGIQTASSIEPNIGNRKLSDAPNDLIRGEKEKIGISLHHGASDFGSPSSSSPASPIHHHVGREPNSSITSEETQIAIELIFAVINELYSMSSVWNIRKTLLNAAKSYILRPGSPTLETIRTLLQNSMIDAHTSDGAVAEYLSRLRENTLPTEEELKAWPSPPCDEEKERLKEAARKAFVQRGIPQALMSVMGASASREVLEKIFDCLQLENVAKGLVFSILMQALRAVIL